MKYGQVCVFETGLLFGDARLLIFLEPLLEIKNIGFSCDVYFPDVIFYLITKAAFNVHRCEGPFKFWVFHVQICW